MPVSFWWMSLVGATMLLALLHLETRRLSAFLDQATGWIIYIRNLILIHRLAQLMGAREQAANDVFYPRSTACIRFLVLSSVFPSSYSWAWTLAGNPSPVIR